MTSETFRVLSLGAGVQSTTLLLMAEAEGWPLDAAVFADTGWEPKAVYAHLAWLERTVKTPIHRVSAGDIRADMIEGRFPKVPLYVRHDDGRSLMLGRQCTRHYKVYPVRRWLQQHRDRRPVELWMGISTDEAGRMRDSDVGYITHRYPLVDHWLTRRDCLDWLTDHGYPQPPKSACVGCPYRKDSQWRDIRDSPDEWADAVAVDAAIRHPERIEGSAYLHRQLTPLPQVVLQPEDVGQEAFGFGNECEGMCGV